MSGVKQFTVRLDKSIWAFLKHLSIEKEISMNSIIEKQLEKFKKEYERKS
jgi:predicted HicB family RNase H-like nuclease